MINCVKKEVVEFYYPLNIYDENSVVEARKQFKKNRENRIITKTYNNDELYCVDEFMNNIWVINDGLHDYNLDFYINNVNYKKYYQKLFGINHKQFILYVKALVVNNIGDLVAGSLRNLTLDIRNVININYDNAKKIHIINTNRVFEFFESLPGNSEEKEKLLNLIIASKTIYDERRARTLSEYNSYFRFSEIIKDYWKNYTLEKSFIFYFPIYLWWELTTIIPLRPKEFITLPYDCLIQKENVWYIIIRRTNQKGHKKKKHYSIDDSFEKTKFIVNNELADNINKYKELTKKYSRNSRDFLLNENAYFDLLNQKKYYRSQYFTMHMFNSTLQSFYHNVVNDMYGIRIMDDVQNQFLPEDKINYINCGDTRHLAIQNIVFSCQDIRMSMQLAGHEKVETTLHYAENFSNYLKCYTYQLYSNYRKNKVEYPMESLSLFNVNYKELSDGGKCYSGKFFVENFDDCCSDCKQCYYYRPSNNVLKTEDDDVYIRRLNDELQGLIRAIKSLSKPTQKSVNKLFQAVNRTKGVCNQLQKYYLEKLERENNGTK